MAEKNKIIGDILITFNDIKQKLPARSISSWQELFIIDNCRVYTTATDQNWAGFPLIEYVDDQWQIFVLGEFYGEKPDLVKAVKHPEILNGHLLLVAHDRIFKNWHCITNRLGTLHAYIANHGNGLALGTFSPAVASASSKEIDWTAISGFFQFGFFLGDTTYWKDLRIIRPATHVIIDNEGKFVSEKTYWNMGYQPNERLPYSEFINEFKERFESVLSDQVAGKTVALPISGGLDSRCTVAALCIPNQNSDFQPYPYSYGYTEDSVETRIAREVARKRNLDIKIWTIQPYLFDKINKITACLEGFSDITHCRQAYVVDDLADHATHLLAAHWGDVWFDDMGFLDYKGMPSDFELAILLKKKFIKKKSFSILLDLFKDNLPNDKDLQIEEMFARDLSRIKNIVDVDFKVKAWKSFQWSFRWTLSSLRMFQTGLFPILPFYENQIVDFFLQVPASYISGRKLQIDYLKRFAPDLARVRWQAYNANLYEIDFFNSLLLPRRIITKLRSKLLKNQNLKRNWEIQFLSHNGKIGLNKYLIDEGIKLHNYVPREQLLNLVKQFYSCPSSELAYPISMLVTFSSWLENYQ